MTDHSIRSSFEIEARQIEDAYRATYPGHDYGVECVLMVFRILPSASMTVAHISNIAAAVYQLPDIDLADACRKLQRAKALRSRSLQGKRHYEINFAD